jgi:hypothetical protein
LFGFSFGATHLVASRSYNPTASRIWLRRNCQTLAAIWSIGGRATGVEICEGWRQRSHKQFLLEQRYHFPASVMNLVSGSSSSIALPCKRLNTAAERTGKKRPYLAKAGVAIVTMQGQSALQRKTHQTNTKDHHESKTNQETR